jgi:hypothetical protein
LGKDAKKYIAHLSPEASNVQLITYSAEFARKRRK